MGSAADLETVIAQEKALVYPAFAETEAHGLGETLREIALSRGLAVAIDVRFWNRPLFYAALPGSTAANFDWLQRKINTVRLYQKSTYRMFLEQGGQHRLLPPDFGLPPEAHSIAGGAFPIRAAGVGAVGAVAVSGLPHRADHDLVVDGLAAHLGLAGHVPVLADEAP